MIQKHTAKKKSKVQPAVKAKKPVAKTTNGSSKQSSSKKLSEELLLQMHDLMVKSRVLEDRLIKVYKAGDAYFWIGGPGEEAWGVPLGLLGKIGQGPENDYWHLHYRCTPTLIAMGMPMIDSIRLIMNKATDTSTGGRNFSNHYCYPKWNVVPVSSPIEVQYVHALGTAHVQKRHGKKAITIVSGGDAGTAEGDFASSLIWSSRKGNELPMLITVQNNLWGISTSFEGQHGESFIADRAKAFNIRSIVIDGNDPVESYLKIKESMDYIRDTGKPAFIEARVSRLYGHSSATGANLVGQESDCLKNFEKSLLQQGVISENSVKSVYEKYEEEGFQAQQLVRSELPPEAVSVWDHIFANNENGDWRKF
jgi:2-oxoisovalerate dehydrogenase E1 component alpha subunit